MSVLGDDDSIEFWCDAVDVEVDVVGPSGMSRLLWDICVNLGFCGGLMDGEPTDVLDLLPPAGPVTAAMFAKLAVVADGAKPDGVEAQLRRWGPSLEAKFVEHLGASVVPAETLRKTERRPFDPTDPCALPDQMGRSIRIAGKRTPPGNEVWIGSSRRKPSEA